MIPQLVDALWMRSLASRDNLRGRIRIRHSQHSLRLNHLQRSGAAIPPAITRMKLLEEGSATSALAFLFNNQFVDILAHKLFDRLRRHDGGMKRPNGGKLSHWVTREPAMVAPGVGSGTWLGVAGRMGKIVERELIGGAWMIQPAAALDEVGKLCMDK